MTEKPDFNIAAHYVLMNEDGVPWDHDTGSFTNNPRDPGGATKWGVTKVAFEGYVGHELDVQHVIDMPRETALAVYRLNFWSKINGDLYNSQAAATAILDTAVNKGLGGCMVILTDALHQHFEVRYGDLLVKTVNTIGAKEFLLAFVPAVERYVEARCSLHPNMLWAKKGWLARADRLLDLAP